ncbi:MAG: mucoidy inhibitor MuiA family protein [Sphingomonadaceae bacterium]
MKKQQCPRQLSAALGAALVCAASAAYAENAARITAVTLYPGSATVERTVKVTPGMTRLEIFGLPANFDPQSVRVNADEGVRVGEVSTRDAARTRAPDPREAQLEDRIQALKDRQSELDAQVKSAQMVNEFLSRLGGPAEKPAPVPDARSLAGVIELIRKNSSESLARVERAKVEKRETGKQIAALERDLARLRSGATDTRTILVGVSGEGTARVSYQVNGAGWQPAYRASLDSSASKLELVRQAIVEQRTGEDWSGVKLKLSTGLPRLSPQGPDPRTWYVSLVEPQAYARALGMAAKAPAAAMQREMSADRADTPEQKPAEVQTTFATEFEVPGLVTLPSDGRKVTVSLAKLALPAKMQLRVVPRQDVAAIVTAQAKRPDGVWLPGRIELSRDGDYVGSTAWNPQADGDLVLPFGRDSLVRVKVDRMKNRNGSAGLIGGKNEREVSDLVTLTSFHKRTLPLLVLESSPVPTDDRIEIRTEFQPKPQRESWENRQGVVAWERDIAPGETVNISARYTVVYPREVAVVGLP